MKKVLNVTSLAAIAALALAGCDSTSGDAQANDDFPNDRLELIVTYGAGGATDTHARAFAEQMSDVLGEQVQVVNKPGATGAVGTSEGAQADPDGHTLIFTGATSLVSVPLMQDVSYEISDFQGIRMVPEQGYAVVASADEYESLSDLAEADGRVTYGRTGTGNPTHLASEQFIKQAGLDAEGVPFDSAADSLQAVRGGQVDFAIGDLNIFGPQSLQDDSLVALAVTTEERMPQLPDVPTVAEAGFDDMTGYGAKFALTVPSGTPDDVVEVLKEATDEVLETSEFQEFMDSNYLIHSTVPDEEPDWFESWLESERERIENDLKELDIALETN